MRRTTRARTRTNRRSNLATQSAYTSQTPTSVNINDGSAIIVGNRITPSVNGAITAIKVYRATTAPSSLIGVIYTDSGTELGRVTFGTLSAGWNTAVLTTPVTVIANTVYRVCYWSNGPYVASTGTTPLVNSKLTVGDGFYIYNATPLFPSTSVVGSAFFADVVFQYTAVGSNVVVPPAGPFPYKTITPNARVRNCQGAAEDYTTGRIYLTQNSDVPDASVDISDLTISEYDAAGNYISTMFILLGGHGDLFQIEHSNGTVYCLFRYKSLSGSHDNSGTWVRLPYVASANYSDAQIMSYAIPAPTASTLDKRGWFQGEAYYNGVTYRVYGTPYNTAGSTVDPAVPVILETIVNNVITGTESLAGLGRVDSNPANGPIPVTGQAGQGRLEPQSVSLTFIDGWPHLLINIAIGTSGVYKAALYKYGIQV